MQWSVILLFLQLWGNVEVSLSQNACSKLPDVTHALVSELTKKAEYQEGDVIHFTCEPGYISSQVSKYVCTRGGWLSIRQGTCYSCSTLPDVPHAHISEETKKTEYHEGDVIDFTCEPGYTSALTIRYVCMSEGWLTVGQGRCHFSASGCDPSPADEGITVKGLPESDSPILPDHVITFSCDDPGKYLNGSSVLICGEDGQWNNPFPTCVADKCKVTGVPSNVRIKTRVLDNQLQKGQKLRFDCRNRGETLRGNEVVECLTGGQWSEPFPTCGAPLDCERPPALVDGDTQGTSQYRYRHGDRVRYICQNFYTLEGEPHKTCNNGKWIGQMRCIKPCTVTDEAMSERNIAFKYTQDKKLYSAHNDVIEFRCVGRTKPVGTLNMRQKCVEGVMHLPTCQ